MRTVILCLVFLIAGIAAGSVFMAYFLNLAHKRYYVTLASTELGTAAMQAEQLKFGEASTVLQTLENGIPDQVLLVNETQSMRDTPPVDSALMATKRFYVCTKTPIPEKIAAILEPVELAANACAPNAE